ncbi:PqqD family protein [Bacillus gobiensis]|uniref:PqqD family protein n=1 Tax=Bacillus gobiensis TaxID=1441095 RepID=UPI003D2330A5
MIQPLKEVLKIERIPSLPVHVTLKKKHLTDDQLGAEFPINESAYHMLKEMDGKKTEGEITESIAKIFNVKEKVISNDFNKLLLELNSHYLVALRYQSPSLLVTFLLQFFKQYHFKYKERYMSNGESFWSIFFTCLFIVTKKIIFIWFLFMIVATVAFLIIPDQSIVNIAVYFTVIYIALITGTALHETAHGYCHRKFAGNHGPRGFFASDMMSVKFVRPVIKPYKLKMLWITALGPLVPGLLGASGIMITFLYLRENPVSSGFFIFSIIYFIHLLYLLPFMGDGKSIIKQLMLERMGGQK